MLRTVFFSRSQEPTVEKNSNGATQMFYMQWRAFELLPLSLYQAYQLMLRNLSSNCSLNWLWVNKCRLLPKTNSKLPKTSTNDH